ncbi:putative fatty acyl-CoA reductase CG5065 [Euwallacea fornicatus]|uniref:putative fatty acyl-CoA reductase CG5065 n=1 Tax=Euwallacea fornicatus TaxID=995702 RepID=UPI00338E162E
MTSWEETIPIPQCFAGKNVFITGGSGFMGKVLIDKLLRCCPDLKTIYILLRPKKGRNLEERIKLICDVPLFDKLKREHPSRLQKIVPVAGDVSLLGLGLSDESRSMLIKEVNIIYHVAASVRFDDPLKDAIFMNTRGTREAVHLAEEVENLDVFLHVSTTYSHTDKEVIEEKMYPPIADWRETIKTAENTDSHILNVFTPHFINPFPNTYTFTKRLAENVVYDLCNGRIPAVIVRPSIVISTINDPIPGWTDNFNGPVGMLVGGGKGILRSIYTNPDVIPDYVPADMVIKSLILTSWAKAIETHKGERLNTSIYNASNNNVNNMTLGDMVEMGAKIAWEVPFNTILWYPGGAITKFYTVHLLKVILYHLLPALFIDGLLKLFGHKPILLKIQRKIYIANMALQFYMTREWTFVNNKIIKLETSILPLDEADFGLGKKDLDRFEYFKSAALGAKRYLLKEDINCMEQAKKNSQRMYVLSVACKILWYLAIAHFLINKINILDLLGHLVNKIILYLNNL